MARVVRPAGRNGDLERRRAAVVEEPRDIPVGTVVVVEDPFGNRLVLLDLSRRNT